MRPGASWGAALVAGFLAVFASPARADVQIAPPDQGFSARFPNQPEQKVVEKSGATMTIYSVTDAGRIFLVGSAVLPSDPDFGVESQSILSGMVERFRGEILSVEKKDFITASGEKIPEKHFTFGNEKFWGDGIVIFSGRHAYVVTVAKLGKAEGLDEDGRKFIGSFKVLD